MGPSPGRMVRSSPRPPSPQGRPHGGIVFLTVIPGLGQEGATASPARRLTLRLDPTVSHPRRLETSAPGCTRQLLPQRPAMDTATADPDLGPDDLVCRPDRRRALPHGAHLLRPRPLSQAEAPRPALQWLLRGGAAPPPD